MHSLKAVLWLIAVATAASAWHDHRVDYRAHPPLVMVEGAARDTLNAAYRRYLSDSARPPMPEQGFCAATWELQRLGWNARRLVIREVVRAEVDPSPVRVTIPCARRWTAGAGVVIHLHPPQQCVIGAEWKTWRECGPEPRESARCVASALDYADTLTHPQVAGRLVMCAPDRFVFYHGTSLL